MADLNSNVKDLSKRWLQGIELVEQSLKEMERQAEVYTRTLEALQCRLDEYEERMGDVDEQPGTDVEQSDFWEMEGLKETIAREWVRQGEEIRDLRSKAEDAVKSFKSAEVYLEILDEEVELPSGTDSPIRKAFAELRKEVKGPLDEIVRVFATLDDGEDVHQRLTVSLFFRDRIKEIRKRFLDLVGPGFFSSCVQHEVGARDVVLSSSGKPLDAPEVDEAVRELLGLAGLTQILPKSNTPMITKHHVMDGEERSDIPRGKISRVKQRGFLRDDKVLLKAQVVLSKGR